jgi:hypothetical protein
VEGRLHQAPYHKGWKLEGSALIGVLPSLAGWRGHDLCCDGSLERWAVPAAQLSELLSTAAGAKYNLYSISRRNWHCAWHAGSVLCQSPSLQLPVPTTAFANSRHCFYEFYCTSLQQS